MRPNLSLESIAGALAVLGTGVIMAACGGEEPKTPVNANEVNGAATEKSSEGANHCGAGKEHKAGEAACAAKAGDAKPADATTAAKPADATPAAPSTTPAAATPADAKPADAKAVTTPAPATTTGKKTPPAPATPAKKGGSGSCGAGTCSAKK